MIVFFNEECKSSSETRRFGICDDPPPSTNLAYIDEGNGQNWIATVDNHYQDLINFYGIDHCVEFPPRVDGKSSKRCDGALVFDTTIAFVELKSRNEDGANWIKDAEQQLRVSIEIYEEHGINLPFTDKRAYIVNNMRPQSRTGQAARMEKFHDDTTHVLYIKATIALYSPEG